jgi:hypothetical protein
MIMPDVTADAMFEEDFAGRTLPLGTDCSHFPFAWRGAGHT